MMTHPLLVEALTLPYWISTFFAYFNVSSTKYKCLKIW